LRGNLGLAPTAQRIAGHLAFYAARLMAAAAADSALFERFSQKRLEADRTSRRGKKNH
jgi:hypothetical protein